MGGVFIFAVVVFYLNTTSPLEAAESLSFLGIAAAGFAAVAIGLSQMIFKKTLEGPLQEKKGLQEKMALFQTSHIMRMAMLEAAALFGCVAAMLTADNLPLAAVAVVLGIMFLRMPTSESLTKELHLSAEERRQLDN